MSQPRANSLDILQKKLWASLSDSERKFRRASVVVAHLHVNVTRAFCALPAPGVAVDRRSHEVPYFESLADAVIDALAFMSRHEISLESLPAEAEALKDMGLDDAVPYLHRLLSGAYMNIQKDKQLDTLFFVQLATFVYTCHRLATSHGRDLRRMIVARRVKFSATPWIE
jgi:hypothetical protein